MKIVYDNIVYSLQKAGGISSVWKELTSKFLESNRHDLIFLEYPDAVLNIFRKKMHISGIKIKKLNSFCFLIRRYLNPSYSSESRFIFHSSYFRICKNPNAINVSTIHDFTYDNFFKHQRKGWFLHIWQRNAAIRKSQAIVCISENTKKDLLKFVPNIDTSKIHVIYNGVSEDYKLLKERDISLSDYLLFVGDRSDYKNATWLVSVIKDSAYKIIFCGSPLTAKEKEYFDDALGSERYLVKTHISNEELNYIYNSVKCLVYPSSYEGFGIPIIEAQKAGCPVIAYNNTSIPEVIGDTPLLMTELTKKELFSKLELLESTSVREKIIKEGLNNSKRFSWSKTYKEYEKLYQSLF